MDELKISLSPEAVQNTNEAIQCLREAASEIFNSAEQNFQEIKDTEWYQRLWKLITFSKDNEKKLANGVSNLAKLQEIVMKALLLLAEKSAEISDFVCQHDEELARLSKNQASLAKTQNSILDELDRLKSGAEKTITLYDIEGDKRKIFMTAFCSVVDSMDCSTSLCQEYYRQVCHALEFSDAQPGIMLSSVDMLTHRESLLLYRVIMEYVFLGTYCFECEAEILKYLAISPKNSETTKAFIAKQVTRGGKEILLTNHNDNEYAFVEDDEIDWDFDDEDEFEAEDTQERTPEMETVYVNKLTQVRSGERLQFYKKNVYIEANIDCHGELQFFGCNVYYNTGASIGKITLSPESQLNIWNSHVFGGSLDETYFVRGKQADISCLNSTFHNCQRFISVTDSEFYMDKCGVYNCIRGFVCVDNGINCSVENTLIKVDDPTIIAREITYKNEHSGLSSPNIFDIDRWCEYKNNLFYCPFEFEDSLWLTVFWGEQHSVENCTFITLGSQSIHYSCYPKTISNCLFVGGSNVISLNDKSNLENSMFVGCRNSISCEKDVIKGCTFVDCQRISIEAQFRGGAVIEDCLFINTKVISKEPKDKWGNEIGPCIKVYCDREFMEKGTNQPTHISGCTFYNLNNYDYIIAPAAVNKPEGVIAEIENCRFANCDCVGAIQKDTYYYSGMFDIKKTVRGVMKVANCEGVDLYGWRRNTEKTISNSEVNVDLTEKPYGCEYLTSIFYFNHDLASDDKLRPWISDFENRVIADPE